MKLFKFFLLLFIFVSANANNDKSNLLVLIDKEFNYPLFYNFLAIIVVIFVIFIYRHYIIQKSNRELKQRVEEELKKSREKDKILFHQSKLVSMGEMLENIAHQWRQPLSQINSAVFVLDDILHQNKCKDLKIEEKLLEIESLTTYLSKTINDFKDFFDKHKKREEFSLKEVLERSLYILNGTFKSNNIEIDIDLDEEFRSFGYPSELQQVIVAILNNARDALVSKKVSQPEIYLRVDSSDDYYHIYIFDNAGGVESEILDKIFEPYFTTKYKSQGTGLGLYIAKLIVEDSLHGELSVKNTLEGACFHISIKVEHE